MKIGLALVMFLSINLTYAKNAKVKIIRGKATMLAPGMLKAKRIKKGDILPEDSSVVTKSKTFVKVVFPDKTSMNIGPKSMVVIKKIPKKKSNVVNLLTGMIKAEVKKGKSNKDTKTKMIVKTRSAVMGVRGTKFQSTYNPVNKSTSLVTVEGKVAMVKVKKEPIVKKAVESSTSISSPNPTPKIENIADNLEKADEIFESADAVEVPAGRYSGVVNAVEKPTIPVKIAPKQYNAIAKSMGSKKTAKDVMKPTDLDPKPEGFTDKATGTVAPKAGGYIDFKTGIYVPPSAQAKLDKETGTFKAEKVGNVDNKTGDYIPPKGIKLDEKKGFVIDKKESEKIASTQAKEELQKTLVGLNNEYEKQVKVNKIENKNSKPFYEKWLPKNNLITFQMRPYSEILTVKNKESGSEADFYTESARWTILTFHQEWNDKWSSRLRFGGQNYEIDESDVNVYNYGGDDGDNYFSIGAGYVYSEKVTLWFDLVDRSEYYVTPAGGDGVEIRTNSLGSIDVTAEYKLQNWRMFEVSAFGTLHLFFDDSVPSAFGGDEKADFFGFSGGANFLYTFKPNLKLNTSTYYTRISADADSIEYTRNAFGLGLDLIYDI